LVYQVILLFIGNKKGRNWEGGRVRKEEGEAKKY